ncbi:hypothetical protein M427DRAFT_115079 [Gonapodya prolifera JEL478]|uniref:RBR-type E3 ubiquitin transferase n=1 Tax=Gonapodya prolifera (strain JEL478) TaxID=1344416 RepID=A0A139A3X6_GONPJ|nr:hypothetical protein M427DRAFT_115079 [Gonapodya prolifera JEL478]|eukprot:KXS11288.1 hypothetical protein M427DRAFT_115079 [Gonapodya prolifera JEL478]
MLGILRFFGLDAKPPPSRECAVCADTKEVTMYPRRPVTSQCTHEVDTCLSCLSKHINNEVHSKMGTQITCPSVDCKKDLEFEDVHRLAAERDFLRYDELLRNKVLTSLPNFRWCKAARCGNGQEHEGGDDLPIMACGTCKKLSCFTHDIVWHKGVSCDEYDRTIRVQEIASLHYLETNTKECPKCKRNIEKDGGCDHMTCRKASGGCGFEFCWLCLADYKEIRRVGNHKHQRTCRYYSPNA